MVDTQKSSVGSLTRFSVEVLLHCTGFLLVLSQQKERPGVRQGTAAVTKTLVICCVLLILLHGDYNQINKHYQDPYEPVSTMECAKGFER